MTEPTVYQPSVLRVDPETLLALRSAIDATLLELTPHLRRMENDGHIPGPWLGDSVSYETWVFYTENVMNAPDGPFHALLAYERQLIAIRDRLDEIEAGYAANEDSTRALFGRSL